MPLESTLNALWVFLGIAAVALAFAAAYLHPGSRSCQRRHILRVVLVVAVLFPYISSTDDSLRLQYLHSQQQTNSTDDRNHDNLMRLYEAMDAPIAGQSYRLVLMLFVLALVVAPVVATLERALPRFAGRSPPFRFVA